MDEKASTLYSRTFLTKFGFLLGYCFHNPKTYSDVILMTGQQQTAFSRRFLIEA